MGPQRQLAHDFYVLFVWRGVFVCALQRVLAAYCQALHHRLPKTASGQTNVAPPYVGNEWYIKVSDVQRYTHTGRVWQR